MVRWTNRGDAARRAAEVLGNPPSGSRGRPPAARGVLHQARMETAVQEGQPSFPHAANLALSIATAGVWLPVYGLWWLGSAQRRYQRRRRALLRAEGLM